ncbi:prolyl oligopeptidase family serine peptidase [Halobacillus shinanisalinarum]|uniref:Prolyl oligopeptidase family serine peptidase n=1 Tax=Halobacillus shinanisalinarum TaxID=2932258 RepID=A0ABY4GXC4_9BACI|nr:alpha/beta fold hydrolase [Halobacillus shinanisalinarum]UOQ92816.1 prolyl oligopeptidase family serine peptidase [Halobacillus shinanisalinarum]
MISIYREKFNDIPGLVIVEDEKREKPLPVFTYFHGFTSAKEHNLPQAYLLAEKGYRVILPDSLYHGDREEEQLTKRELNFKFWDIVNQNLKDLKDIKSELDRQNLIKDHRFGVGGTSMGGVTTSAALTIYPWIQAAAVMMGSPKPVEFAQKLIKDVEMTGIELPLSKEELDYLYDSLGAVDLSVQMDKLQERPLFFWHGDADPVVPYEHSYDFYNQAIEYYKNPENIRFLREVGRDHKVSRFAIKEMVNWIEIVL